MKMVFIRHGTTHLNQQGIFCGESVDPPLSVDGATELRSLVSDHPYPGVDRVFSSPSLRCRMTAQIIYPQHSLTIIDNLREMAFGEYDGKLSTDVHQTPHWQLREQQGELFTMPGGESYRQVSQRMISAIEEILQEANGCSQIAVVTHSLAIMWLFKSTLTVPLTRTESFCPNGMGYLTELNPHDWTSNHQIIYLGPLPEGAKRPDMSQSPYMGKK
ncbi:MAG: histidine phosphatase family protein [Angelakisella sp.]